MIKVASFTFNDFAENTYVLHDETNACAIFDPGCYRPNEQQELTAYITNHALKPVALVNTHCHIDHILGNYFVSKTYNLPVYLHKDEEITMQEAASWASVFNVDVSLQPEERIYLTAQDTLKFGNTEMQILFTPGHSRASLSFVHTESKIIIAGDVLFNGSIGRTDLPGGDFDTLIRSIRSQLFTLPDDFTVYSGHGPSTTIGREKRSNPFLV